MNWAWLAGFFDGEGNIGLKGQPGAVRLQISQKNEALLREIQSEVGGRVVEDKRFPGCFTLCLQRGAEVSRLLSEIIPFLRVKRARAEIALRLVGLQAEGQSRARGPRGFARNPYRDERARLARLLAES